MFWSCCFRDCPQINACCKAAFSILQSSCHSNAGDIIIHDGKDPKPAAGVRFRLTTFGLQVESEIAELAPTAPGTGFLIRKKQCSSLWRPGAPPVRVNPSIPVQVRICETPMEPHIDIISYQGIRPKESHSHAQLVLAIEGGMEIEIDGKAGTLDAHCGAFVASGVTHSQLAHRGNKFLVLNCDGTSLDAPLVAYLGERTFLPVSPATKQLIDYADNARQEGIPFDVLSCHWTQLLLGSLASHRLCIPRSGLFKLAALVEKSLDYPWTVREMADNAGLSVSRLHAVFQEEWNTTPQEWLSRLRIRKAQYWLASTDRPIAELAQLVGYSDQSALTRAMRRITGMSPAEYRKQRREPWSKIQ